jgi:hypothetical protein
VTDDGPARLPKARRSVCVNNLRQINLGLRMYANDHGDVLSLVSAVTSQHSTMTRLPDTITNGAQIELLAVISESAKRIETRKCACITLHDCKQKRQ